MNRTLQISLILGVLLYLYILISLMRKKSLNLKYTLLWIFSGIVMQIIALFPSILVKFTSSIGIIDVTNGLFALILFFIFIILMSITSIVSKMNDKNKQLTQEFSLLEMRVRKLEKEKDKGNMDEKIYNI